MRMALTCTTGLRPGAGGGAGRRPGGLPHFARMLAFLLCALPAMAAVTGTVINRTTGQPQAGATVGFYKLVNAFQLAEEVKTDGQGNFSINDAPDGAKPNMIRTTYDGVGYIHMLPPGSPATGLTLDVYNASRQPGAAKVSKHMILFQPGGGELTVNETYILENDGKTAWNDPEGGALRVWAPAAQDKINVNGTAADANGMGIPATLVKTSTPNVFGVNFPVKPGETRIDIDYTVPYTEGAPYKGKIVSKDDNTYLVAPNGVGIAGEKLNDLGLEPKTQARIYGLTGTAYEIQLNGEPVEAAASDNAAGAAADDSGAPKAEVEAPHVFGQVYLILGLALGILALTFAILYRASGTAKENNERGRG